ncbi:PRC-barrel domain containing protein [Candidatus Poribacteria bacterium]|nr:PRC-barrel domain containing protein [Candidatus Poribacteria bacterium]
MLRNIKEIQGYTIRAIDGEIGNVHDFYFDDRMWVIRYMIADTGGWLSGRKVLISPIALDKPKWEEEILPVNLKKEKVENSPGVDTEKTVSRQHERETLEYYRWPIYWEYMSYPSITAARTTVHPEMAAKQAEKEPQEEKKEEGDSHLRSTKEVEDYKIQANDGEIGHVDDYVVDDEDWTIRYIVVDTRNWLPGKKVLVAPQWIKNVEWTNRKVYVDLPKEAIKNSPEFDPSSPINRDYENRLYDYYGRRKYWTETLEQRKDIG